MTNDDATPGTARFSLSRWSERKRASARGEPLAEPAPADASANVLLPADAVPGATAANARAPASPGAAPLPPVESLTFDSDFTVFMNADVDEAVKRSALRKLLRDPRFNVMDGLDTYIDDYSLPDPIPPSMLAQLRHSVATLNPVFEESDQALGDRAADPASARTGATQPSTPPAAMVPDTKVATPAQIAGVASAPADEDPHRAPDDARQPVAAADAPAPGTDEQSGPQSAPAAAVRTSDRSGP
jgi:hypothetical protein